MNAFWKTLLAPHVGGNTFALLLLFVAQAAFCWGHYRRAEYGWAMAFCAMAAANFTRLVESRETIAKLTGINR